MRLQDTLKHSNHHDEHGEVRRQQHVHVCCRDRPPAVAQAAPSSGTFLLIKASSVVSERRTFRGPKVTNMKWKVPGEQPLGPWTPPFTSTVRISERNILLSHSQNASTYCSQTVDRLSGRRGCAGHSLMHVPSGIWFGLHLHCTTGRGLESRCLSVPIHVVIVLDYRIGILLVKSTEIDYGRSA